eukprot:COSAG02_NODE_657_length_18797_cov_34.071238_13_plen_342_part_00
MSRRHIFGSWWSGGSSGGEFLDRLVSNTPWSALCLSVAVHVWCAYSAFCPIFRAHGRRTGSLPQDDSGTCGRTGASNEIWNFGEEAELAIAKVMRIREQLRPYIMEQYQVASQTGTPVMRPLFYDFWDDPMAATVDDQLMFGPGESATPFLCAMHSANLVMFMMFDVRSDYLVAPVLVENATERFVYLPKLPIPYVWQDYFDGTIINTTAKSANISVLTPLDTFPLYRRHKAVCYPPALPPPPPPGKPKVVTCGPSCTMHSSTDHDGGGHISESNCSTFPMCCALCKANKACGAFVWGPKIANQEAGPTNPNTCFLLKPTNVTVEATGRTFGCVDSQSNRA